MAIRVIVAGATGWTGSALVKGVIAASDMELVGAIARKAAGQDAGVATGGKAIGLPISSSLEDALMKPCDVVVDYTKPNVVKQHALATIGKGVAFVVGTSGLSAQDYAEIDFGRQGQGGRRVRGRQLLDHRDPAREIRGRGGEIRRRRRGHRLCGRRQAGRALGHRARARRAALAARRPSTSRPVAELTGPKETRGATIGAVQVTFRAGAGLRALLRGRVRRTRRAPCHSPRRRLLRRALCGGDVARHQARARQGRPQARPRSVDGMKGKGE